MLTESSLSDARRPAHEETVHIWRHNGRLTVGAFRRAAVRDPHLLRRAHAVLGLQPLRVKSRRAPPAPARAPPRHPSRRPIPLVFSATSSSVSPPSTHRSECPASVQPRPKSSTRPAHACTRSGPKSEATRLREAQRPRAALLERVRASPHLAYCVAQAQGENSGGLARGHGKGQLPNLAWPHANVAHGLQ